MNSESVNSSCSLSVATEFLSVISQSLASTAKRSAAHLASDLANDLASDLASDLPNLPIGGSPDSLGDPAALEGIPVAEIHPCATSLYSTDPYSTAPHSTAPHSTDPHSTDHYSTDDRLLREELTAKLLIDCAAESLTNSPAVGILVDRILNEVERICDKSDRIRNSDQPQTWLLNLARHRLHKCLHYYKLGSRRGRVELHSHLSTMIYRHIVAGQPQLGFTARYGLIEDFLQGFYIEVLKAFRREHQFPEDYCPRSRLQLAEYMAFTEQYAKRKIGLPGRRTQQLIILRAQGFAHRQPPETAIDLEMAIESAKSEEAEQLSRSPLVQQVREQMVAETTDPTDFVLRDRVVTELISYLEAQGQPDCVDYLTLKLQDLSAPEIDEILNLSPRQRDYLQQRFKYHVEKFSRSHRWQLVHQWLGADLDQNLGMSMQQWETFLQQLSPDQQQLIQLKRQQRSDQEIAKRLRCTPKQVQKRWVTLLEMAWQTRNNIGS